MYVNLFFSLGANPADGGVDGGEGGDEQEAAGGGRQAPPQTRGGDNVPTKVGGLYDLG